MSVSKTTTDHDTIRAWAEARGGRPSAIRTSGPGGILRLDFGEKEEALDQIGWDEFFKIFDENALAFVYQDETAKGDESRFGKFIARD